MLEFSEMVYFGYEEELNYDYSPDYKTEWNEIKNKFVLKK